MGLSPWDKQVPAKGRVTAWGDGFREEKPWQQSPGEMGTGHSLGFR